MVHYTKETGHKCILKPRIDVGHVNGREQIFTIDGGGVEK